MCDGGHIFHIRKIHHRNIAVLRFSLYQSEIMLVKMSDLTL